MARHDRNRATDRSGVQIPVDLYRGFVFPNRMREQRQRQGHPKLLPFAARVPEIPYIRLSKIERGEVVARPQELRCIAAALGIEPAELLLDIDAPGFDIARWAEPFFDPSSADIAAEQFAVLLGSALRARRTNDPVLTIAAIDRDYRLPAVNLSRIENAQKPFARWNVPTQEALYAIFGVADEAELRAHIDAQYRSGALDGFLAGAADPAGRHERSRLRIRELAAALARAEEPPKAAEPAPRAATRNGTRMVAVHGGPLPDGLIADLPTGDTVEAPRAAGARAFGLKVGRASLGAGMPAQSIVIADPDRYPVPGGLTLLREAEGWRLLAVASARGGGMIGYSANPEIERALDDCDPASLAAVIAALFV